MRASGSPVRGPPTSAPATQNRPCETTRTELSRTPPNTPAPESEKTQPSLLLWGGRLWGGRPRPRATPWSRLAPQPLIPATLDLDQAVVERWPSAYVGQSLRRQRVRVPPIRRPLGPPC